MPDALLRACTTNGCPNTSTGGKCEACRRAKGKAYDSHRGSAAERGYTWRWTQYRRVFLSKYRLCGDRPDGAPVTSDSKCALAQRVVAATVVDHIVPASGPHDPTFFRPECHQALCAPCHNAKRQRESRQARSL